MVKVKLHGLKIANSRGKYYVYVRATGDMLLKGFDGTKAQLLQRLAMPDMIGVYNVRRDRDPKTYADGTLGALVHWFTTVCPEYKALAQVTRDEYADRLNWLEPEFDTPLNGPDGITQADCYIVRDKCAADKWPAFADKMMTALSSMFGQAVKRNKMKNNPAFGIEKVNKANPNANREWRPEEWDIAFQHATLRYRIPMMIARHIGYRGQSIVKVQWRHYEYDADYTKCFRFTHRKNSEPTWTPAPIELQEFLDALDKTSNFIAVKNNGTPWRDEAQLQTAFKNFIASLEAKKLVEPGLTLHGLRVTFAAAIKRDALKRDETIPNNVAVAAALGDRDERMGKHYTRHVENEINVMQAFPKPNRPSGKPKA